MITASSLTHKVSCALILLSLFAPVFKSFAQVPALVTPTSKHLNPPPPNSNIEKDKAAVQEMLNNPKLVPFLQQQRKNEWREYRKENGGWGGGHSVRRAPGDRPVLLDFFTEAPHFVDSSYQNPPLVETDAMKYLGFQEVRVQELPAYKGAKRIIESWKAGNESLVEIILIGLDNLSVQYVWRGVPLADSGTYFLPPSLRSQFTQGMLTPVVAYHQHYGLKISAPEWNLLGDYSQIGLLIHEALRRVQISYKLEVSQEKLQHLTATMVLKLPADGIRLETTEFVDQGLLTELKRISAAKFIPADVQQRACAIETLTSVSGNGVKLWQDPAGYIASICKSSRNRNETNVRICSQAKRPKSDLYFLATEAMLAIYTQMSINGTQRLEQSAVDGNMHEHFNETEFRIDSNMYLIALPSVLSNSIPQSSKASAWNRWRQASCQRGISLTQESLIRLVQLLAQSNFHEQRIYTDAINAYVSLQDTSAKKSVPELVEIISRRKRAEDAARDTYKDTLMTDVIDRHIGGRQLHPDFLKIVQGYRAVERYMQLNIPAERERF